jgi:hypothetical protein
VPRKLLSADLSADVKPTPILAPSLPRARSPAILTPLPCTSACEGTVEHAGCIEQVVIVTAEEFSLVRGSVVG